MRANGGESVVFHCKSNIYLSICQIKFEFSRENLEVFLPLYSTTQWKDWNFVTQTSYIQRFTDKIAVFSRQNGILMGFVRKRKPLAKLLHYYGCRCSVRRNECTWRFLRIRLTIQQKSSISIKTTWQFNRNPRPLELNSCIIRNVLHSSSTIF